MKYLMFCSNLSLSASGSILPPLPYEPADREKLPIDTEDTNPKKNPKTDDIEHCLLFGVPGIDDGVFTYRGNLEACTDVMNLLHSGKFKVGYKPLPSSLPPKAESKTSLELLFSEKQSLESIPER